MKIMNALDEYLLDYCWMVTCDHYLDGLLAYRT